MAAARRRKRRRPRGAASTGAAKKANRGPAVDAKPASSTKQRSAEKKKLDWAEIGRAYGTLLVSAILMFLGFAGFGIWPLAFVGMVPAMLVLDADPPAWFNRATGWAFFRRALFFGYVAYYGGFHWVADTIHVFGEFPYLLAALFASAFFLFQAGQFVLVLFLFRRARDRGFSGALAIVASFVGVELVFPHLFDHFYGNSLHAVTPLVQVADLGGPMLVTALLMAGNGAAYALARAWLKKERSPRAAPLAFVAALLLTLAYGAYRISEVEARMEVAETLDVGVIQVDMGIAARHRAPGESTRRHLAQSLELESEGPVDLLIWPESSLDFGMRRDQGEPVAPTFRYMLEDQFRRPYPGFPEAPILFGASSRAEFQGQMRPRNTSFLIGSDGRVAGLYDKTYLLMFGEYLPFGNTFPILYEWSPNSGNFVPGDDVSPVMLGEHPITVLVCYEDILPRFTRSAVREGQPHLLVNQTNDAWFIGQEPHVHLALAEMRAVEHHRTLIRATLTGVSAVIDPLGRVVQQTEVDEPANLRATVPMMSEPTLYETVGDWPGWLALGGIVLLAFVGRRRRREDSDGADREAPDAEASPEPARNEPSKPKKRKERPPDDDDE